MFQNSVARGIPQHPLATVRFLPPVLADTISTSFPWTTLGPACRQHRFPLWGNSMSQVLYEANPSMVRMNPFGTVFTIFLLCGGVVCALPPVAAPLAAMTGLPELTGTMVSIAGMAVATLAFLRLLVWWVTTKLDQLTIKEDEIIWSHGWLSKQYTEINMGSVRTVRVNQSIWQRIMGAGDVTVFTTGDLPEVVIRGLPNPNSIREYVKGEPNS